MNVENADNLRQGVMKGNFQAALLKPHMIVAPFQVITAANRAVHLQKAKKMMTKTVFSEVLFCLSPRKNISNAFKIFGTGDKDTNVFVVTVNDLDQSNLTKIKDLVKGTMVDPRTVSDHTDVEAIKQIYNISDKELSVSSLLDAVVSRIASKDIVQV